MEIFLVKRIILLIVIQLSMKILKLRNYVIRKDLYTIAKIIL